MLNLLLAAVFWIAIHLVVAGSLRERVVARVGENAFRGLFSLLSFVGLLWLIFAYRYAPLQTLWPTDNWLSSVPVIVMPFALLLFIGSVTAPNPTAVGAESVLQREESAKGVMRITRHPMLWSFALWAGVHLLANGDIASLLLFGSILFVALNGMASIDRKRARRDAANWGRYAGKTSIMPLAAILAGRNRLALDEIWWQAVLALAVWALLIWLHPLVFGVPAVR